MPWYNTEGPCSDYVLFSKVRYIRNLANTPFYKNADAASCAELSSRIDALLSKNGFTGEKSAVSDNNTLLALAEKQLADPGFLLPQGRTRMPRALYLNEPCNLVIAVGGLDTVSISSLTSGLSVNEAKNIASGAEELIDKEIGFAYSDKLGYLSPRVALCGSGVELSAALFLPTLSLEGRFEELRASLERVGLHLSPLFDKRNSGDIYIISWIPPHLCDESAAVGFFSEILKKTVDEERGRLHMLFPDVERIIEEGALRALGTLLWSARLTLDELMSLISDIRLYLCLAKDKSKAKLPGFSSLSLLLAEGQDCSLAASSGGGCTSQDACDRARAELVKKYIELQKEVH